MPEQTAQKKRPQRRKPAPKSQAIDAAIKPESIAEQPEVQTEEAPMSDALMTEIEQLRKRNAELEAMQANHEAEIQTTVANTLEQMKKSSHIEIAKERVRIDSFPGVDRDKPRWYGVAWDKIEGGDVVPLNGLVKIKIRGGGSTILGETEVRVIDGLFVTNDLSLAQMCSKDPRFTGVQPVN